MAKDEVAPHTRRDLLLIAASGAAALSLTWRRGALAQTAGASPLKIAIIGAGREGSALGTVLVRAGHPVMFASRHPEELKDLVAGLSPLARAGTVAQAIDFGDVVMIVVPYTAMEQIGKDYAGALAKKPLVIDVSNPIGRRDGDELVNWVNEQGGAGLATAKLLPGAHLVRAFNAIGSVKLGECASPRGACRRADRGRRPERYRDRLEPHSRDGVRTRRGRRARDGQIPGSGDAARRRAHAGGNPSDRRQPALSRA
jgi:8-hydroxy-5-deazaflavin:NADPH oxidoreductase